MSDQSVRALVFDLDGTLADTAPELTDALNDSFSALGLPLAGEKLVASWVGNGAKELFITALAQTRGLGKEEILADPAYPAQAEQFQHFYHQRCGTRASLYPGGRELLDELAQTGIGCAMLTNKERLFTNKVLEHLGITDCFEPLVCGDTLATKKPDPDGLLYCAKQLGATPEETVFVGDSWVDVATARAAGMPVWACTYGYNRGEPIANEHPDRLIDNLGQIPALLARTASA